MTGAKEVAERILKRARQLEFLEVKAGSIDTHNAITVCTRILELEERNDEREKEHAIWEKHSLVQIVKERDALKSQLTELNNALTSSNNLHQLLVKQLAQARQIIEADNAALKLTEQKLATSQARCGKLIEENERLKNEHTKGRQGFSKETARRKILVKSCKDRYLLAMDGGEQQGKTCRTPRCPRMDFRMKTFLAYLIAAVLITVLAVVVVVPIYWAMNILVNE